jgi:hypothetical protein
MARRRRSRARENPSTGFWIAAAVGVVAVGGVAYVLTRPSTASASTQPKAVAPVPTPGAALTQAQINSSVSTDLPAGSETTTIASNAVGRAVFLSQIGHLKEGVYWANLAKANGISAAQQAQLKSAGY